MSKKMNRLQCDILLKRMRQNPEMAKGMVKENRERVKKLWKQLAEELNRAGPPEKNESEWRKAWTDRKRYERQKGHLSTRFAKYFEDESNEETQDISVVKEPIELTEVKNKTPHSHSIEECHSNQSIPENLSASQPLFNEDDDPLTQKSENTDSTQFVFKRLHLSLEHLCYQKQMELDETKRHNMQIEMIEQEKIAIKSRLLKLKEENLRLLRQSMTKKSCEVQQKHA